MNSLAQTLAENADRLLERMVAQQREKVLRIAREAVPYLSFDDVLNPHDHPELAEHPLFDYEDGLLAGLLAAQTALRAELRAGLSADTP